MRFVRELLALGLCLGVLGVPAPSLAQAQKKSQDLVMRDDAKCTTCHDEVDSPKVMQIGKTRHGTIADKRTGTCTTCHGASEKHIKEAEAGSKTPAFPDIAFGKKAKTPMETRSQACLTCHQGGKRIHWQASTHSSRDMSCASCHQVHTAHDKALDKQAQTDVCFTCHKEQRAQINRPSRHPIREGKIACSDCHNPHGSAGEKQLLRDNTNDTCYACHMEKRGPFVRTHAPVQENCSICHNPHGTTNDNLLKLRTPHLCQQCHEPTSHRGAAGNFAATGNNRNLIARGCLNCHTNIHGTNNTFDDAGERSLRR